VASPFFIITPKPPPREVVIEPVRLSKVQEVAHLDRRPTGRSTEGQKGRKAENV